ncbi:MAG TPA: hypothetical protein H9924_10135 [Candidatus Phocaeicola merdavium]|nr:hypothetical protein [Candidatus Phocaeicola merdavium]
MNWLMHPYALADAAVCIFVSSQMPDWQEAYKSKRYSQLYAKNTSLVSINYLKILSV